MAGLWPAVVRDLIGLVADLTPSSVTAGGGVLIAHVVVQMCCSISMVALDFAAVGRGLKKSGESPGNEEPCWPFGEQGSRNSMISMSDRELPACLLGEVFIRATRLSETDARDEAQHIGSTQPGGCGRMF